METDSIVNDDFKADELKLFEELEGFSSIFSSEPKMSDGWLKCSSIAKRYNITKGAAYGRMIRLCESGQAEKVIWKKDSYFRIVKSDKEGDG